VVRCLIGSTNGTTTTYDLTDAQGSVLMSLSSAGVQGEQVFGPYGNSRYSQGSMTTDKGYTSQFHDAASGLDYYNARYYDPVLGQFLSTDSVQGNEPLQWHIETSVRKRGDLGTRAI
jgi:RHS repeat-associated protein